MPENDAPPPRRKPPPPPPGLARRARGEATDKPGGPAKPAAPQGPVAPTAPQASARDDSIEHLFEDGGPEDHANGVAAHPPAHLDHRGNAQSAVSGEMHIARLPGRPPPAPKPPRTDETEVTPAPDRQALLEYAQSEFGDDEDGETGKLEVADGDASMPPSPTVAVPGRGAAATRSTTAVLEAYADDARVAIAGYERDLKHETDASRVGRLHYEIARLYESVLDDLVRGHAHYAKAIEAIPDHLPTIVGARRVLIARGDWVQALEMFDREIRVTADRRDKAALMFAKARLLEDRLGRLPDARRLYAAAAELAEGDAVLLKGLEYAEHQRKDWAGLAGVHGRTANAVAADPGHRAALVARRARLVEVHQHDPDAAAELLEAAVTLDRHTTGSIDALKRLHTDRRRWRELIRVLEREAESARDAAVRTMARYRIGQIQADQLGNRSEAISILELAAKEQPAQPFVLESLCRLYESAGAQPALARTLARLVDCTSDPHERLGYLHRIGELHRDALDDDDGAIAAYEAALAIDPSYIPALRALAPMYTAKRRFDELVQMHESEARATADPSRRATAHARVGEILERLGRSVEAIAHHEHALALDPEPSSSFRALIRLYAQAEDHHKLIELYDRALEHVELERQIEYLFAIGDIHRSALHDPEQAEHTYRRILKLRPRHLGAAHALQRVAESFERWTALVDALELETQMISDPKEIVALVHRVGTILVDNLDRPRDAVGRFRRVLELDPHHVPTLAALGRIYHADGHWNDLVDIYRRELEVTPSGAGAIALLHKLGDVQLRFLADPRHAADCFRKVLELDPAHGPSVHALARILRDQGAWKELVALTEAEVAALKDPASRALASFRAGEILEESLDDKVGAEAAYARALALHAHFRPALDALTRVRAQLQHWKELAEDLETSAGTVAEPKLAREAWLRAGEVWWDHVGDAERAIACYERILAEEPDSLACLLAVEPLYRETRALKKLAAVYSWQLKVFKDDGANVAALRERARVLEAVGSGEPDDLVDCYTQILALRPSDRIALDGLETLALRSGDPRVLASVDARLAKAAKTPELRAAYLTRQAESQETAGQPQAIDVYRAALRLDPHSRSALRGLGRVAEVLGDPTAMVDAARGEAATATDPQAGAKAWIKSGEVNLERRADVEAAIADFGQALSLWPDHELAAARVTQLLGDRGEWEVLVERLARAWTDARDPERQAALAIEVARIHAEELGNLGAALSALTRLTVAQPKNARALVELGELLVSDRRFGEARALGDRAVLLPDSGEVKLHAHLLLARCHEQADEHTSAFKHYETALELDPDNIDILKRVVELQMKAKAYAAAITTASRLLQVSGDTRTRTQALGILAHAKAASGHIDEAVVHLANLVAIEGPAGEAASTMGKLASERGHWELYVEALRKHLGEFPEGASRAPLYLEIARTQSERLRAEDQALGTLVEGLRASGGDRDLRFELGRRLRHARRLPEALEQFQFLLMDDVVRVEAWRYLAQTFEQLGRQREGTMAFSALAVLEEATPAELEDVRAWQPRTGALAPNSFVPGAVSELFVAADQQLAAASLLAAMHDGLGKLRPTDLSAYGVASRDKIPPRSDHSLRVMVDRLCEIFGVEECDLYVHRKRELAFVVEATSRPSLVAPAWMLELPPAQQIFMIAESLVNLARQVYLVDLLSSRDLEILLTAAARTVSPSFGEQIASADVLDERQRLLAKGIPRRKRKIFEAAAEAYVRSRGPETATFVQWVKQTARRVALVAADDLSAAVAVASRRDGPAAKKGIALVRSSPVVADLLKVWVSKPAMEIRHRTGLLPPGGALSPGPPSRG